MKTVNIFCLIAKTGAGKSTFMNELLKDETFMKLNELSLLVYGTTRNKRPGEVEDKDYHFCTLKEFNKIPDEDLIEFRRYDTLNDGTIFYFTKKEYINGSNILAQISPYQYESFCEWTNKQMENPDNKTEYNLFPIILDCDLKVRTNRLLARVSSDNDIFEFCRRIVDEKKEFDSVSVKFPEIIEETGKSILIDNSSSNNDDFFNNIQRIKNFIINVNRLIKIRNDVSKIV